MLDEEFSGKPCNMMQHVIDKGLLFFASRLHPGLMTLPSMALLLDVSAVRLRNFQSGDGWKVVAETGRLFGRVSMNDGATMCYPDVEKKHLFCSRGTIIYGHTHVASREIAKFSHNSMAVIL